MASNPIISVAATNDALDAITALIATGADLKIWSGTIPADAGTAATGSVLATASLNATPFGAAASGVATANAIAGVSVGATGTATFFRVYSQASATDPTHCVFQGTVGATGSGEDMEMPTTSLVAGMTVTVDSLTLTLPTGA